MVSTKYTFTLQKLQILCQCLFEGEVLDFKLDTHYFLSAHVTIYVWLILLQMEQIVEKMQDEVSGVPVKTVKSFMSKIPSVFTGE